MPVAKVGLKCRQRGGRFFGPMGPAHQLAKHFFHDGSHISRIIYPSVVGTLAGGFLIDNIDLKYIGLLGGALCYWAGLSEPVCDHYLA